MKKQTLTLLSTLLLAACQPSEQANTTPPVASEAIQPASFMGSDIRQDEIGGDFTLTDANGQAFTMSSLHGKAVILSFGFTHCPDVCPTELLSFKETIEQLGEQAKDVAVVFVSVDPDRDTPDLMNRYMKLFHPDFIGLTDTEGGSQLAYAKQLYRIISAKTEIRSETLYNMDHSSGAYLLDKQGNAVVFEPYGADPSQIAADLRILLAQ